MAADAGPASLGAHAVQVLLTADAVFSLLEPVPLGAARLLTLGTAALSVMALLMVSGTAARAWVAEGDARR